MSYNLSTVRTRVQQRLDDSSFSTVFLNQFINDAQRDILNSRRFDFMEAEADVTTSVGVNTLTGVPSTMQVPLSLRVYSPDGNATVLPYIEYEDIDIIVPNMSFISNTSPSRWYVFARVPYIYPNADATYTIKLRYIKTPTELSNDADVPEIPEDFSELLVLAALKRAHEFNDDNDKAQLVQMQVDELMEKMDERYKRQAGTPHFLRLINRRRRV